MFLRPPNSLERKEKTTRLLKSTPPSKTLWQLCFLPAFGSILKPLAKVPTQIEPKHSQTDRQVS